MQIVIDTNLWVSGLLWRGLPWRLIRLAESGKVRICMAYPMLLELQEVLSYGRLQARLNELRLTGADLIGFVMGLVTVFEVTRSEPIVLADPDDDIFLLCAVSANATYVISGDHHLLNLGRHGEIPIVTIRDFFAREFPDQLSDK